LRERVKKRTAQGTDASEADLHVLEHQIRTGQPLDYDELDEVVRIYGAAAPNESENKI